MEPAEKERSEGTLKEDIVEARPVVIQREAEKDLVVWNAASRPFKRRDKQFFVTRLSMLSLVCLILFLAEGAMPVILIVSLMFLYFVLSTVEPGNIEYKITNKGIKVAGKRTDWNQMGRFWFSTRSGNDVLMVETYAIPGRMELIINSSVKNQIEASLSRYLDQEEIPPSKMDKVVEWFAQKLPQ